MTNQITTATNTQAPNLSGTQNDPNKFFNNFFAVDFSIGAQNDAITAFFESYTGDPTSGKALAAAVIYTARAQNKDPMVVMAEFKQLTPGQLNSYLAAFLNSSRALTSQLGIKTSPTTPPAVSRLIIM